MTRLVLASASPFRKAMLETAGLTVEAIAADIDERAVGEALGDAADDGEVVAAVLAEAKAENVSARELDAIVIGADQTLSLDGKLFHKPSDMAEARRNLLTLSGKTHHLNSAVALVADGKTLWRHTQTARMTMRDLEPGYVGRYLAGAGEVVLKSVGAYQVEGLGINLFEKIDGDHFAIVGMPLLPLLAELRRLDAIDG